MSVSIEKKREQEVFKKNDLIQKSRYSLTMRQLKLLDFLISKINSNDVEETPYSFTVQDFIDVCGLLPNESYHTVIKQELKAIADCSVWVKERDNKERLVRWIDEAIAKEDGIYTIKFDETVKNYLFGLKDTNGYTRYRLDNIIFLRSHYSIKLFQLCVSHRNQQFFIIDIEELKTLLDVKYQHFYDLNRKVIKPSIDEINAISDIEVNYQAVKDSRKVVALKFVIRSKRPHTINANITNINKNARARNPRATVYPITDETD